MEENIYYNHNILKMFFIKHLIWKTNTGHIRIFCDLRNIKHIDFNKIELAKQSKSLKSKNMLTTLMENN